MSHTRSFQLLFVTVWMFITINSASAKWFIDLYGGGAVLEGNDVTITSDKLSVGGISPGNQLQGLSVCATLKDVEGDDFPCEGEESRDRNGPERPLWDSGALVSILRYVRSDKLLFYTLT